MCFKGTRALFKYTVSYTSDICARSEQCGEFVFYIGIKLFLIAPLLGCYWFSFMQLTPCQFIDFSSSKALLRLFDWKLILVNKIPYKTKEDPNVHLKICAFILIFLILYRDFSVCLRALKCHKIASFCCGGNWCMPKCSIQVLAILFPRFVLTYFALILYFWILKFWEFT